MNDTHAGSSVIVGVDGSQTAVDAALWAVDEAVTRSVPLRLIYVTKAEHPSADDYYADIRHAEESLRAAEAAVEATGKTVKVETQMVEGPPAAALLAESDEAALVCVGSVGIGRYARSILGSTATELAEKARCPVAIIRPEDDHQQHAVNWIVVGVNDRPDNDVVVEAAMREARLREAPVLVMGSRAGLERDVEELRESHPDVHVYPVSSASDVVRFLKKHDERVQLAVVGSGETSKLADILGPYGHHRPHHTQSSVLVVRR